MIKRRFRFHLIISLLLLIPVLSFQRVAAQEQPEPIEIGLGITDTGFECFNGCDYVEMGGTGWGFTIEVDQGALVTLTFEWRHQSYILDEHIMVLKEYNLEWDKLNSENREATLQFIANEGGNFDIKCDIECEVHDFMQDGLLVVRQTGGAGQAVFSPTSLELIPASNETAGESISIMAVLKGEEDGAPVSKAEIVFYQEVTFAGVEGRMKIGDTRTDENGIAFFEFQPTVDDPHQHIIASFEGGGIYAEAISSTLIEATEPPPPFTRVNTDRFAGIRSWAPLILAFILVGIWSTFAYVLWQIYRIRSESSQLEPHTNPASTGSTHN